jgi:hypothetical protein
MGVRSLQEGCTGLYSYPGLGEVVPQVSEGIDCLMVTMATRGQIRKLSQGTGTRSCDFPAGLKSRAVPLQWNCGNSHIQLYSVCTV